MLKTYAVLGLLLCGSAAVAAEVEPTFPQTFQQFQTALNGTIREDAHGDGSGIAKCRRATHQIECTLGGAAFRSSLAEMKRLNLMNGNFSYKVRLEVGVAADGKLTRVILYGDRGDPPNLLDWYGNVIDVIRVWDPDTGRHDDLKQIADQLGLMRGDAAGDIGTPKVDIFDHVAVTCFARPSSESKAVACKFEPRS